MAADVVNLEIDGSNGDSCDNLGHVLRRGALTPVSGLYSRIFGTMHSLWFVQGRRLEVTFRHEQRKEEWRQFSCNICVPKCEAFISTSDGLDAALYPVLTYPRENLVGEPSSVTEGFYCCELSDNIIMRIYTQSYRTPLADDLKRPS